MDGATERGRSRRCRRPPSRGLETLRDVEADRRAGSLDDAAYADQLAEAEARAAATRAALERPDALSPPGGTPRARATRSGLVAAGVIGALLMVGALLPATGLANRVVVNEALADAQAGEAERQDRIVELLGALDPDAPDAATLSALADAYLAGSTGDDLVRAAVTLQLLIEVEPDRADAYERLMTAYLRAGDYRNARAVHDSYATVATADPVEVAFFDGLIALRGENDAAAALEAFERFLELAPDDPRAGMVRGLRDEAARRPLALVDHAGEHPLERGEVVGREPVEEVRGHAAQVRGRGAPQAADGRHRSAPPTGRGGRTRSMTRSTSPSATRRSTRRVTPERDRRSRSASSLMRSRRSGAAAS